MTPGNLRIQPRPTELLKDAFTAAVDGTILCGHDSLERTLTLHVTCKRRKFWYNHNNLCKKAHVLEVLKTGPKMLTLNFVPDLAAPIILSTRAAAIWFFTGPSFPVFDMLEVRIGNRTPQEPERSLQELVL